MSNVADKDAYTAVTAEMLGVDGQQIADALAADEPTAAQKKLVAYRAAAKHACLGLTYCVRPPLPAKKLAITAAEARKVTNEFIRHWPALVVGGRTKDSN